MCWMTRTGTDFSSFASALVLLGVGWNFLFIGGTTLLSTTYSPAEKSRAQATNDMTIFAVSLACSFSTGGLLQTFGWHTQWASTALARCCWAHSGMVRHQEPSQKAGSGRLWEEAHMMAKAPLIDIARSCNKVLRWINDREGNCLSQVRNVCAFIFDSIGRLLIYFRIENQRSTRTEPSIIRKCIQRFVELDERRPFKPLDLAEDCGG